MAEAVCHAAEILGLPAEVVNSFLKLIKSVEEGVHDQKVNLAAAPPCVDRTELLDRLIQEYCDKL